MAKTEYRPGKLMRFTTQMVTKDEYWYKESQGKDENRRFIHEKSRKVKTCSGMKRAYNNQKGEN